MVWNHKNTFAIGGLQNVGYAPKSDLLMVLSTQGQGIFNCRNGEQLARSYNDLDWVEFDEITNAVAGFDLLKGQVVKTFGLYGGDGLLKTTSDGWALMAVQHKVRGIGLAHHISTHVIIKQSGTQLKMKVAEDGACELRAFGFSETGMSFVVATSCELIIYCR